MKSNTLYKHYSMIWTANTAQKLLVYQLYNRISEHHAETELFHSSVSHTVNVTFLRRVMTYKIEWFCYFRLCSIQSPPSQPHS